MIDPRLHGYQFEGLHARVIRTIRLRGGTVVPVGRLVVIDSYWRGTFNVSWRGRRPPALMRIHRSARHVHRSDLELVDEPRPAKGPTATWRQQYGCYATAPVPLNKLARELTTDARLAGPVVSSVIEQVCRERGVCCEFRR